MKTLKKRSAVDTERLRIDKCCLLCEKPLTGRIKRGLHNACYQQLYKFITGGATTWEELVACGYVAPEATPGPKNANKEKIELLQLLDDRLKDLTTSKAKGKR